MFTGLIEETGTIRQVRPLAGGRLFIIGCQHILDDLAVDDSVAVNGACLTVSALSSGGFEATAVKETLQSTTLGDLKQGSRVNLERAARLDRRMGGHLVQGHVDCTTRVLSIVTSGAETRLTLEIPSQLRPYIIRKGSITIDGVSLTVAFLDHRRFEIAVIPHTWSRTTLALLKPGSRVNIEADMIARYIEQFIHQPNRNR
ncbi:riboflavin synthase [bacterium]|nr:riboflavin synthase [bacterium]